MRTHLDLRNAKDLFYRNGVFDLVIPINTIHNLARDDALEALREIERVAKGNLLIIVDVWKTEEERVDLENWVPTANTRLHANACRALFEDMGYVGEYSFLSPC
ncbi:class I SAM-dependent methyltransferase [Actinomycetota bacterium]|nr:class I SAM-dependent methyltransferase [Actinomycetota bacterium]